MSLSFPEFINEHVTAVKIVPKKSSDFMVSLGRLLDWATKLKITNITKDQFLNEFTTTLGDTIYSDELTMDSAPSTLLLHELCHVLQFKNRRMPFEYVVYPESRAYYESEAVLATMVCFPDGEFDDAFVERRVSNIIRYGVSRKVASAAMSDRMREYASGKIEARPKCLKAALEAWRFNVGH